MPAETPPIETWVQTPQFVKELFASLGVTVDSPGANAGGMWLDCRSGEVLESESPASGEVLGSVQMASSDDYERVVESAEKGFATWRQVPAPVRGQVIRDLGNLLRQHREPLGELVSLEMGKIRAEGIGEVQEMIDICDFAVGLSRQLCGSTMHSERPGHRMYEQWHPVGPVGIISAFNFPVAVWAWNAALAAICGNTMIWKPSPSTPLTAIAVQRLCDQVMKTHDCEGLFSLVIGGNETIGETLIRDKRLPLISFTGSCEVGRHVASVVGQRLGKSILELGGNNALIVAADADLDLATRAILFGAVGTSGQRCTTTRRLLMQREIAEELQDRLVAAYAQVTIGDPLDPAVLMGPLASRSAVDRMQTALNNACHEGGNLVYGGDVLDDLPGHFVRPALVRMPAQTEQVKLETFAPILYAMTFDSIEGAIAMQNDVPQGLSSAVFTESLRTAETFLSAAGSDCGIANVNIGTSGAEIGGAFGGEKDTGGGRESGSDAWKGYMRRQTNTINWSRSLPLAQGIEFGSA